MTSMFIRPRVTVGDLLASFTPPSNTAARIWT
jgi:hypothetical protein